MAPLQVGLVSNVDTAVETFLSKARQAGVDTVRQSYKKQWLTYCQQHGFK